MNRLAVLLVFAMLRPAMADSETSSTNTPGAAADTPAAKPVERLREGNQITDRLGHFKNVGDRIVFYSEGGKAQFVALENLNLERIARTIINHPQKLTWKVSGVVTEYRATNNLLVDQAILKSKWDNPSSLPPIGLP